MVTLSGRVATALESAGVIQESRLRATTTLAWPRIVTGFAIMSKQTVDLALVGWTVGATAVAGLAFAYAYWLVAKMGAVGLAGGTVSLVSQNYGGEDRARASLVVKQSIWVAALAGVPLVALYVLVPERLVAVLGSNPAAIEHGTTYLTLVAPALLFEFFNLTASRTYAGVGDTFTPMVVRAGGGLLNMFASGVLVFGLGMGVAGVALGTVLATGAVSVGIGWGLFGYSYGVGWMAPSPVPLRVDGRQFHRELMGQLVTVSAPLIARRVAEVLVVFPLLWIASSFGPVVVAAFEVGRRVRDLSMSFSWGFSIASSTLVGQALGAGDEAEAKAYGDSIIRLSAVVYLLVAAVVVVLAPWIARLFVSGPAELAQTTPFVRVAALSAILLGVNDSITGTLRGAGDTTWPFIAALLGRYVVSLPLAVLGLLTTLDVWGLYLALVFGAFVPNLVNLWRYRTGRWRAVSRTYRPHTPE